MYSIYIRQENQVFFKTCFFTLLKTSPVSLCLLLCFCLLCFYILCAILPIPFSISCRNPFSSCVSIEVSSLTSSVNHCKLIFLLSFFQLQSCLFISAPLLAIQFLPLFLFANWSFSSVLTSIHVLNSRLPPFCPFVVFLIHLLQFFNIILSVPLPFCLYLPPIPRHNSVSHSLLPLLAILASSSSSFLLSEFTVLCVLFLAILSSFDFYLIEIMILSISPFPSFCSILAIFFYLFLAVQSCPLLQSLPCFTYFLYVMLSSFDVSFFAVLLYIYIFLSIFNPVFISFSFAPYKVSSLSFNFSPGFVPNNRRFPFAFSS
jgi:hypothetical protein